MLNSMKSYFRRLAEGYENGLVSSLLFPVLGASEKVYGGAVGATRFLYEKKVLRRTRLPFPVVSVGNLTWGGTGKTPFVEYLARKIGEQNKTPLILTRGYSHDEIEQFRRHLPRAIVGVGKHRGRVAKNLAKQHPIDLAILDDGFQHWPLERNFEIVMVNALNPFGNGRVLPRGILREPRTVLRKAHLVAISHSNLITSQDLTALKEEIRKAAPEAIVIETYLEPLFFYRARKGARVSLDRLQKQRVTTFSAVGSPRSFQLLLAKHQIKAVRNFEFTDHHAYSRPELEEIKEVSHAAAVDEVVTTEKDFYRSSQMISDLLNPLVLATRLRIASGEELLWNRIFQLMGAVRP